MTSSLGKLLVYVPTSPRRRGRLSVIRGAASRVAEKLGLEIEISETERVSSFYVFYLYKGVDDMPVYCDLGKDWDEEKIYNSILSVVYALSFLPEFSILQPIRGELRCQML